MAIKLDKLAGPNGSSESKRLASHWLDQIDTIKDSSEYKRWYKRGEDIEKRYRDDRARIEGAGVKRYNALWSSVEILRPALYGKVPLPVVERRFKDKDPTGRNASSILERGLRNEIEVCGYNEAMQQSVSDYLLPGRGTVWVRYEPQIEESVSLGPETATDMRDTQGPIGEDAEEEDAEGEGRRPADQRLRLKEDSVEQDQYHPAQGEDHELEEQHLRETGDRIIRESTPVDYVPWKDFFNFPSRARVWAEVTAVGKRAYMSRDQLKRRFGKAIGKEVPTKRDDRGRGLDNGGDDDDKALVYEIWSRDDECVYWVAEGYDYLCDRKDDPLGLEGFFPCPRPLFANATNTTLIPVPDYIQYQDQAMQIDELTQRIAMLARACKVAGVYNAAAKSVSRLLNESVENELIPVDDWAAFGGEKGGVAGNISLLPVQDIIGVINELTLVKAKQIEELDRITGITDIMRGATDARETLGGQRLKSNSSGTRLTSRQNEVARFARDTVRIMADIMCQHFSPQSLIEVSGALYEEGLGPEEMPQLSALQAPPQAPPPAPPQASPSPLPGPPPGMPGMPPGPPAGPAGPLPGVAPPAPPPMGQNVVPFRPSGLPAPMPPAPSPMGMPPGPPPGLAGPVPPPIPPEMQAQLAAVQRITKALALIRNERLRGFRVDIEVDSTIFPDAAQEKQDRTEFITATTAFFEKAMMVGGTMPEAIPLLGKLLQFGVRGYRVGRDLELALEEFCDEAVVKAKERIAQAAQQPNPEQLKLQAAAISGKNAIQVASIKAQSDAISGQTDLQMAQLDAQSQREQAAAEVERQQEESRGEAENSQFDLVMKRMEMQMRAMEQQMEQMRMVMDQKQLMADEKKMDHEGEMAEQQMDHEGEMAEHETELAKIEAKTAKTVAQQKAREANKPKPKPKSA